MKRPLTKLAIVTVVSFCAFALLLALLSLLQNPVQIEQSPPVVKTVQAPPVIPPNPDELASLINQERAKLSLGQLAVSQALNQSAADKCADMVAKDYWAHDSPDGLEPWMFIQKYTEYKAAGENLAYGFADSPGVITGWMNSPGHKANIVRSVYTQHGYAVCDFRGTNLIVQHLIAQ